MRRIAMMGMILVVAGCGGSKDATAPVTDPVVVPPNVTFASASRLKGSTADAVTTALKNIGGDGSYRIEFLAGPLNVVNATDRVVSTTDVVVVAATYAETVTWSVPRQIGFSSVTQAIIYSRNLNSAVFRETARAAFP